MFNQQSTPYVVDKLLFPVVKKTNCRPPPPILPPNGCIDKAKIRKYPCGFPGCQWVFTRTNHVVRHHERVHPGFKPTHTTSNSRSNNNHHTNNNNNPSSINNNNSNDNLSINKKVATNKTPTNGPQQQVTTTSTPVQSSGQGFKLREALTYSFHLCYVTGCKQRFNTKNELNIHLFHVHSLVEPEVCIKVEGQEWNDEENTTLMTNKLSTPFSSSPLLPSSDHRRYVCDAIGCDKSYTKNSHLIRHKEDSHNLLRPPHPLKFLRSPRPYACTLPGCDKTYTKNSHLIRHLVETHKMAKPAPKVNRRLTPNFGLHPTPTPINNGGNGLLQISSSSSSSSSSLSSSPSSAVTSTSISTASSSSSSMVPTSVNRSAETPMIYNDRPYACTFPGCGWSFKRQYHLNRHIITHRMNNNRNNKDNTNNRNQNNTKNPTNNQANTINSNNNPSPMVNLNNLNNTADLTALINLARNLAAARARSESISWIVLEDGDEEEEDDQPQPQQQQQQPSTQLKDLSTRRHISIEEDTFCCDFPGCGKTFINSRDLMQHYLGHSGPSSGLLLNSHLINSSAHLSQLLDEPPLECVLEEFDDEEEEDIVVGGSNGDHHRADEEEEDENEEEDEEEDDDGDNGLNGHHNGLTINLSKNRDFAKITATDSD